MVAPSKRLFISVIGGGYPTEEAKELAYQVGRELALKACVLVTGGLTGVMEAACKGAKEAGGTTIGILPGNDPKEANPYVDIPICTGIGYARNVIVVKSGRAVIAIDGAFGTLSEIGHALGEDIPVIGLKTWTFSMNGNINDSIIPADTPKDAVEKAIAEAVKREKASTRRVH